LAFAEVSDKIPSIGNLLVQGLAFGVIALGLAWFRWWLGAVGLAVALLMVSGTVDMWQAPYVGGAIRREQGIGYFVGALASALLVLAGSMVGAIVGFRRRSPKKSQESCTRA